MLHTLLAIKELTNNQAADRSTSICSLNYFEQSICPISLHLHHFQQEENQPGT
jgi:hypothetical protein